MNSPKTVINAYILAIIIAFISDWIIFNHFRMLGAFWFIYNATVFLFARFTKLEVR